jgi:hypothetical protein
VKRGRKENFEIEKIGGKFWVWRAIYLKISEVRKFSGKNS